MSQVKNLRAMFENKGDKSPPDRGRSPGVSASRADSSGARRSASPRPLSKVRTNFVAIEKDGRIGLRRDQSGESSLSRRRLSIEADADSSSTSPDKSISTSSHDVFQPAPKQLAMEAESAYEQLPEAIGPGKSIETEPPRFPGSDDIDRVMPESLEKPQPAQSAIAPVPGVTKGRVLDPVSMNKGRKGEYKNTASVAKSPISTVTKGAPRSSSPSVGTRSAVKRPMRSASPSGLSKRDDDISTRKVISKPATQHVEPISKAKFTMAVSRSKASPPRPQLTKGTLGGEPGFVKPKPKSPTRPVNLPSSLTAPTASSVFRGSASNKHASVKQSGSTPPLITNARAFNRTNSLRAPTRTQASMRPKLVTSRPKPSVGPPPAKATGVNTNIVKRQSPIDESFLARMTRPTQSSSSKTAEKSPSTPPKRGIQRPSSTVADRNSRPEPGRRLPVKPRSQTEGQLAAGTQAASEEDDHQAVPELDRALNSRMQDATDGQVQSSSRSALSTPVPVHQIDEKIKPEPAATCEAAVAENSIPDAEFEIDLSMISHKESEQEPGKPMKASETNCESMLVGETGSAVTPMTEPDSPRLRENSVSSDGGEVPAKDILPEADTSRRSDDLTDLAETHDPKSVFYEGVHMEEHQTTALHDPLRGSHSNAVMMNDPERPGPDASDSTGLQDAPLFEVDQTMNLRRSEDGTLCENGRDGLMATPRLSDGSWKTETAAANADREVGLGLPRAASTPAKSQ